MSNPEQDILNELEGIVNNEANNLRETYVKHQKALITDLNNSVGEGLEIGQVRVLVAKRTSMDIFDSISDADLVGISLEKAREEGLVQDGVGSMSGLIDLPKRKHIQEFFGDNGLMLAMCKAHNPDGYAIHTKYSDTKTLTLFVKEDDLLVHYDGKAYIWDYNEADRSEAERVLGAKPYEYLCLIIQALNAPKVFRDEHPKIFEALVEEYMEHRKKLNEEED